MTTLTGTEIAERLTGGNGDEVIDGQGGNDTVDGGAGIDTALYRVGQVSMSGLELSGDATTGWTLSAGGSALLKVQANSSTGIWTVTDLRSQVGANSVAFGTDTLSGIEWLALDA